MAEKGDVAQDTVSLPPTYAPSEAYTESPPPAYRGGREPSGRMVQVVRLLCLTAVVLALLIGFFVLSTNYLKARTCTCDPRPLDTEESRAALLQAGFLQPLLPPSAQPLVKEEDVREKEVEMNSLDAGDDTVLGDKEIPTVIEEEEEEEPQLNAVLEEVAKEVQAEQQLEEEIMREEEEEEEALKDILEAQAEHMKKIRLPVDLILGNNPALSGREVSCDVERRQAPVAPGVMSQTIFVTCKDNGEEDEGGDDLQRGDAPFPMPPRPFRPRQGPPMSLIAPLMKMLSSRPGPQPRLVPISLRGPVQMVPPQPAPSMPQVTLRNPFPLPMSKPRMAPVSVRGPMSVILPRPMNKEGPSDRMLPRHLQPVVRLTPRFISLPRSDPSPPGPISLLGLQRGAIPLPQARPRAPPRPVSLSAAPFPQRPPLPAAFMPFNAIHEPQPRPQPRPATHMEMNAPQEGPQDPTPPRMDFGPPRGHTLINGAPQANPQAAPRSPPRLITLPKAIRVHTLPRESLTPPAPQGHPQQVHHDLPHPPRFAPEPLRSPIPPQENPEAEIIAPQHPQLAPQGDAPPSPPPHRKHHLLMVN